MSHIGPNASLQELNLFVVCGGLGALFAIRRLDRLRADLLDWVIFLITLAMMVSTVRSFAWVGIALIGLHCWRRCPDHGKAAGSILLALAIYGLKGTIWQGVLAFPVMAMEASVLAALISPLQGEAIADGHAVQLADGRTLVILRDCSVLNLLAPAILAMLGVRQMLGHRSQGLLVPMLTLTVLVTLTNLGRLFGMAYSPEAYVFFHDGLGGDISVALIASFTVMIAMPQR
ncbi:MAG: hypothetical protein ACR2RF_04815 [Geminicoccaceae bacterium]